jgi:O-antigen/teichoic acid export membrane protein
MASQDVNGITLPSGGASALGSVARSAVLWSGGSNLLRDLLQFATMLALVRLLTPEDYGRAALAQTALILISVLSFKTFIPHALQLRDPAAVDWQSHFTAAIALNVFAFALTLVVAGAFSLTERYAKAALPLAILSIVFLIEIMATLRHFMTRVAFQWRRFRILITMGSFLDSFGALAIAAVGGGVWALILPRLLFGVPAVIDLFLLAKWRPSWSWSWLRYRETARFGINRMGSAGLIAGRQTVEQMTLAGFYDFAVLGVFTRGVGLATMVAGRIGALAISALYPVITRAEQGSDRFQRIAGLVLRSVSWMTIPAAIFLALAASDVVGLLYGAKWTGVIALLPLAAIQVALGGLAETAYQLLLANDEVKACFRIDILSAVICVVLALWLIPFGPQIYLCGLAAHSALVLTLTLVVLRAKGGIRLAELPATFTPPLTAGLIAGAVLVGLHAALRSIEMLSVRVGIDALVFSVVFLIIIRLGFPRPLRELLHVAPGGRQFALFTYLPMNSD